MDFPENRREPSYTSAIKVKLSTGTDFGIAKWRCIVRLFKNH